MTNKHIVLVVEIPGWCRNPQNLQQRPHPLIPGQQPQQTRQPAALRLCLLVYGICVKDKRHDDGVHQQQHLSFVKTQPLQCEWAQCVCLSSFSELNKPSRSPLTSLHMQQLHCHCSLAAPDRPPVNESRPFTLRATIDHFDKTLKANKKMTQVQVNFLLQWVEQQSSPEDKWRWARRPLQQQHWRSSSLEGWSGSTCSILWLFWWLWSAPLTCVWCVSWQNVLVFILTWSSVASSRTAATGQTAVRVASLCDGCWEWEREICQQR